MMCKLLLTSVAFVVMALPAFAAEISAKKTDGYNFIDVTISGEIERGDEEKFTTAIGGEKDALVYLSGPGGNMRAGLAIGDIIHDRKFGTAIYPNMVCASACAMIWLAGSRHLLFRSSRIGLHGASHPDGKDAPVGDALIGAYLTRLGYGADMVVYVTSVAGKDIKWLSMSDADRMHVSYEIVEKSDEPLPFDRSASRESLPTHADPPPPVATQAKDDIRAVHLICTPTNDNTDQINIDATFDAAERWRMLSWKIIHNIAGRAFDRFLQYGQITRSQTEGKFGYVWTGQRWNNPAEQMQGWLIWNHTPGWQYFETHWKNAVQDFRMEAGCR